MFWNVNYKLGRLCPWRPGRGDPEPSRRALARGRARRGRAADGGAGLRGRDRGRARQGGRNPASSIYHYFGSKDGVLLAVMERGAQRFFGRCRSPTGASVAARAPARPARGRRNDARAPSRLPAHSRRDGNAAHQRRRGRGPPRGQPRRELALVRLRGQMRIVFGLDPDGRGGRSPCAVRLSAFDGAFVAHQSHPVSRLAPCSSICPPRSSRCGESSVGADDAGSISVTSCGRPERSG